MNALELRRRTLGKGVYKKTVEGNPAIATDSLARMYPGITMKGWTEQVQYEGKNLFDLSKISSETATVDGNDILLSSYANSLGPAELFFEPGTQYTIQATREAESQSSSGGMRLLNLSGNAKPDIVIFGSGTGYGTRTFTTLDDLTGYSLYAYGWLNRPGENYRLTQPMIQKGSVATEYEPYTGGKPSPSPEYPQEIVSAGKYNEDTQKWEYEITITNAQTDPDKNQTATLTADRPLSKWDRLEKRNGQWGWVYGSAEVDMSSEVTWVLHPGYEQETSNLFRGVMSGVDKIDSTDMLLCNILPYYQAASADVNGIYSMGNNLFARIIGIKSLEDFQEKIQGGKVLTKLSTETFVPLTTAEQEAMNALHTYRPTTVLSNQQDCDMTLTYKSRKGMS